jgi:type II restriction enzyme
MAIEVFTDGFLSAVQSLVERHHAIYPRLPPQGLFFEALVEQAFRVAGWPADQVLATTPNSPWHDLSVAGVRLSIKSETGKITHATNISITKLCTTETGEWNSIALVANTIAHIKRHDRMLMVRAIWQETSFLYQLVEIPLDLLERITTAEFSEVGNRKGRRSIAANVMGQNERLFRVHFDGSDGKCQIHALLLDRCRLLRKWTQPIAG